MKLLKNNQKSGFTLIEVIITLVIVAVVAAMMTAYFGTGITQSSIPIFRLKGAAKLNDVLEKITAFYSQYPQWQKSTSYAANAVIIPTTPKRTGLRYTTSGGGTSGTVEPDWMTAITMGSTVPVTDGSVIWKTVWDSAHNTATDNGAAPTLVLNRWLTAHTYYTIPASIVYPDTGAGIGNQYICLTGGTSHATTAPTWTIVSSPTIADLTPVLWQYIGPAPTLVLQTAIGTAGTDYTNTTTFGSVTDPVSYRVIENKFIRFDNTVNPATEVDLTSNTTHADYGKYLKVTIGFRSDDPAGTGETLTTLFVLR